MVWHLLLLSLLLLDPTYWKSSYYASKAAKALNQKELASCFGEISTADINCSLECRTHFDDLKKFERIKWDSQEGSRAIFNILCEA
jgi:hypothetical protein